MNAPFPMPINTPEAYEADVLARFGTLDPAKLAAIENAAMWAENPKGPNWNSQAKAANRTAKVNHLPAVDHEARRATILAALPGTLAQIELRTGLTKDVINDSLRALRIQGLAKRTRLGSFSFWEEN